MSESNYVATFFNRNSWNVYGLNFIASLKDLANYKGNILIVDAGIPQRDKNFLAKMAIIIPVIKKYNFLESDFIYTLESYSRNNKGCYAFWNNNCYFQDNIDGVFDICEDKLLCCFQNFLPQPSKISSLPSLGFSEDSSNDPEKLYELIISVYKKYGKGISGDFFAAKSEIISYFKCFLDFCLDNGFVYSPKSHQIALNLFILNHEHFERILDNTWCFGVTEQLKWHQEFFHKETEKVKVINISDGLQFSADATNYHFMNRFPAIYQKWKHDYKKIVHLPKHLVQV